MSDFQQYKIKPDQFLTIVTNILFKTLLDAPRTEAKKIFNAIENGRRVALIDVRMESDATPLPPLNLKKGLQQCPTTEANPSNQRIVTLSAGLDNSTSATKPFDTSLARVIPARNLNPMRRTLLKPGFLEPTFVISTPVPHRETTAKGMAPISKLRRILPISKKSIGEASFETTLKTGDNPCPCAMGWDCE